MKFQLRRPSLPRLSPTAANMALFWLGLALLGVGLGLWYLPAGLAAPGVVLIWVSTAEGKGRP